MSRLTVIYLISTLLFIYNYKPITYIKPKNREESYQLKKLKKNFLNHKNAYVLEAYITGDKKKVKRSIKKDHKILNLYHLFTPSGIHLSALFMIIFPIIKLFFKNKIYYFLISLFCCIPFFLTGFYSLKRIGLFRLLIVFKKNLPKKLYHKINMYYIFLLTFIIDFFWGTYDLSPMSFTFSFLFFGSIISQVDKPFTNIFPALWGGQLIAGFFISEPLALLGFPIGFIITGLFSIIFPILFLNYFIPFFNFSEFIINFFLKIIRYSAEFASSIGFYFSSLPLVIFAIILTTRYKSKIIIILLLLISSNPIPNQALYKFKRYNSFNIETILK